MERSAAPDHPLQCPRCNSSNTKFCYYNNYSLSQPRHFCKACKRYWTRGGTLRNVPVGGGYRKNKKFKRHPPPPLAAAAAYYTAPTKPSSSLQPDLSNRINNPFTYSLPTNLPRELNFPFSETRVSSGSPRFDDLHQSNGPESGLSSYFRNGFEQNIEDRVDFISFGSSSTARRQRFATMASNEFSSSMPNEDMAVGNGEIGKEYSNIIRSNQIEQMNSSSYLWNSNNVGVWFDPSSSVLPSSLI